MAAAIKKSAQARPVSICQCGKTFANPNHYKRHLDSTHGAGPPFPCEYCNKPCKRSDVRREHYKKCPARGDRPIPPSLERGRKRHACDECSRLKVKCDNQDPCEKCVEFGRECVMTRRGGVNASSQGSSPQTPLPADPGRSSINFLLNTTGERDFMREFPESAIISPRNPPAQIPLPIEYPFASGEMATVIPPYPHYNNQVPINSFDAFLTHIGFQTTFLRQTNTWMPGDNTIPWVATGIQDAQISEPRTLRMKEKLKYTASMQSAPELPPGDLLDAIDSITTTSIAENIRLYFRHWHKHAPLVHEASFNPCTAALPLVLALMCLGGMYSKDSDGVIKLKLILDTVETYIFSIPGLNFEYDLPGRQYVRYAPEASENFHQHQLEEIQGAYLFVVLQYWTGNQTARSRVRQDRFGRVVTIFRYLDLPTAQHPPDLIVSDEVSFRKWIRTESAIRLVSVATMLDNVFGIFNNASPQFQWEEIDLPFSCPEMYFSLANYEEMVSKSMYPHPQLKVKRAFFALCTPPDMQGTALQELRNANLSALDMQMLIYFLYAHVWASVTKSPLLSIHGFSRAPFQNALTNWKSLWDEMRNLQGNQWDVSDFHVQAVEYHGLIHDILDSVEAWGGNIPVIPSQCTKGLHLKILLKLG